MAQALPYSRASAAVAAGRAPVLNASRCPLGGRWGVPAAPSRWFLRFCHTIDAS